jgi:PAS domain S-box-containing protein
MDQESEQGANELLEGDSTGGIERDVQQLSAVMRKDIAADEKARRLLELGRRYLRADTGFLTRIDQETDHWEVVVSTDPPGGQFPAGLELDLGNTFCRRTVRVGSQVALSDATKEGWDDDPAFEALGLHSYLGTPIVLDGVGYGTVCFVSKYPQTAGFGDREKLIAELISQMLERALEREQDAFQLQKRTTLGIVLNRLLRRNLHNDMAIIRAFTRIMAGQLADDSYGDRTLQQIDGLLELTEKTRELDELVASDVDPERTAISPVIEGAVKRVRQEYSSASISVTTDEAIIAPIHPSFDRAIGELLDNAAEHGGNEPRIEVTVERIPNAVAIRIADDGPGIESEAADVLRSGTKSPLLHGSGLGLWFTHWIVSNHYGSIDVSGSDAGTTVTMTIPRTPISENLQGGVPDRAGDQYEAAFKEAGDGMTITDDEARILDVNEEAARIYGEERDALIGRSMREFLPDDFDFEAEWGDIQGATVKRDEMTIVSADGGVNPIEYTAKTDFVPGQHLIVSRDISARKRHERRVSALKERYHTLLEESPAPIVIVEDATGTIIETNAAFDALLATSRDQLVGEPLSTVFSAGQADRYREMLADSERPRKTITKLEDGSPLELVPAEGEAVPVEASVGTVTLPDEDVMVSIFRDVSDRGHGPRSLQDRNEELGTFVSEVSHDLRNPLTVANGGLELAQEEFESEHLETIENAHQRMERLISDLLVLAQQGSAVVEREPVALPELVNSCWLNVATEGATLVMDVDRTIRADRGRLQQVFENLFRNAVEHGDGEVTVRVGELAGGFYVEDNGPGIPAAERANVFEAEYSTREDGFGFGLNIATEVIDAHDWEIQVTEGSDGGARFEVTGVDSPAE